MNRWKLYFEELFSKGEAIEAGKKEGDQTDGCTAEKVEKDEVEEVNKGV